MKFKFGHAEDKVHGTLSKSFPQKQLIPVRRH